MNGTVSERLDVSDACTSPDIRTYLTECLFDVCICTHCTSALHCLISYFNSTRRISVIVNDINGYILCDVLFDDSVNSIQCNVFP